MGLEAATYVQDLVTGNPAGGDQKAQGDDHIRLVKTVLKTTFPDATGVVQTKGWNAKTPAVNAQTNDYTLLATDNGKLVTFAIAAAKTFTLLAAATAGAGFVVFVQKDSTINDLVIDGSGAETINGALTLALGPNGGGMLYCTGTAWVFLGMARDQLIGDQLNHRQENDAAAYPGIRLRRSRAVPASSDLGTTVDWEQKDSAGNFDIVARTGVKCIDPVSGSEDYELYWETIIAAARTDRLRLGAGLYTKNAVGGDKGVDTINAKQFYIDGVLQNIFGATIVAGAAHSPALADNGKTFIYTSGAPVTVTVPAASGLVDGWRINLIKQGAGSITLARTGADTLISKGSALTSLLLGVVGDGGSITCDVTNTRFFWQGKRSNTPADIAATVSTDTALAHSLGVAPDYIRTQLVCTVNNLNYTGGVDIVELGVSTTATGGGYIYQSDATNINFKTVNSPTSIPNKTTFASSSITAASWNYRITATVLN